MEMLHILIVVKNTQLYNFLTTHQNGQLKWVYFIVHKVYLNEVEFKTLMEKKKTCIDLFRCLKWSKIYSLITVVQLDFLTQ